MKPRLSGANHWLSRYLPWIVLAGWTLPTLLTQSELGSFVWTVVSCSLWTWLGVWPVLGNGSLLNRLAYAFLGLTAMVVVPSLAFGNGRWDEWRIEIARFATLAIVPSILLQQRGFRLRLAQGDTPCGPGKPQLFQFSLADLFVITAGVALYFSIDQMLRELGRERIITSIVALLETVVLLGALRAHLYWFTFAVSGLTTILTTVVLVYFGIDEWSNWNDCVYVHAITFLVLTLGVLFRWSGYRLERAA